jgi:dihydropteroate synthase
VTLAGTDARPRIFGILNVTPDSFSDGGNFFSAGRAVAHGEALVADGADVIDVGGESTRPGALAVSVEEELRRVIPVIRELACSSSAKISIDTVKSEVARAALDAGAEIVNDVSGMRLDAGMARLCGEAGCEVVLMHSRGTVAEMASYDLATYGDDPVGEIIRELMARVEAVESAGVERSRITIDPGIGFSKRSEHSLAVLAELARFVALGYPVLIGVSRKRVVAELVASRRTPAPDPLNIANDDRDAAGVSSNVAAYLVGAAAFRVHDVRRNRLALDAARKVARGVPAAPAIH